MRITDLPDVKVRQLIADAIRNKEIMVGSNAEGFFQIRTKEQLDAAVANLGSRESEIRDRKLALIAMWEGRQGEQLSFDKGREYLREARKAING
jgi:hypothetical protein